MTKDEQREQLRREHAARRIDFPRNPDNVDDAEFQMFYTALNAVDKYGLTVVVLHENSDTPCTRDDGRPLATADSDEICALWEDATERCNVAAIIPPWAVVLEAANNRAIGRLLQEQLIVGADETWWHKTPHTTQIWHRIPEDTHHAALQTRIADIPDVELIGPGRYVTLPGSQLQVGNMIAPVLSLSDEHVGIAEAGDRLLGIEPLYPSIAALITGGHTLAAPKPTVLQRDDGQNIFYPGELNTIYGPAGDGKTMLALAVIVDELRNGGSAVFVDLDGNGLPATVSRLQQLGASVEALADPTRFRYTAPTEKDRLDRVLADLTDHPPSIVVVDAATPMVTMHGGNSTRDDDYTEIVHRALQPIARAGACVLLVDHVTKDSDATDPAGAASKLRVIGGVAVRTKLMRRLIEGEGGALALRGRKDRHSGLASNCPPTKPGQLFNIGTFLLDLANPDTGVAAWRVTCPGRDVSSAAPDDRQAGDPHDRAADQLQEFTVRELVIAANDLPADVKLAHYTSLKSQTERWITNKAAQGGVRLIADSAPKRWIVAR